jgi:hypothetical protein
MRSAASGAVLVLCEGTTHRHRPPLNPLGHDPVCASSYPLIGCHRHARASDIVITGLLPYLEGDCAALSVKMVRRLSRVPARQGRVDFEEIMITRKLREVERSDRSAAWFEYDPLLCSQRATGAAPASVAG